MSMLDTFLFCTPLLVTCISTEAFAHAAHSTPVAFLPVSPAHAALPTTISPWGTDSTTAICAFAGLCLALYVLVKPAGLCDARLVA